MVAIQVAEQMADYLVNGAVSNALNMPSITAEEATAPDALCQARRSAGLLCRSADRNEPQGHPYRV